MRKVRCVQGHYYDADVSVLCPHCGLPEASNEQVEFSLSTEEQKISVKPKKGFFSWKKTEKQEKSGDVPDKDFTISKESSVESEDTYTVKRENTLQQLSLSNGGKTYSLWSKKDAAGDDELVLEDRLRGAPDPNENRNRDINEIKTVSKYAGQDGLEPVTGWLVCVTGINYGRAYQLKSGQSTIGRDNSMDICIKEDGISREKHAFIIFEPKKRQFLLRGGDGSGLTYCNEELVTGMVPINAYDRIQLGNAVFVFVPFCGEQFMWDESDK